MFFRDMEDRNRVPISEWAKEDRPREKLLLKGISALSDAELLAILIGSGNSDESAVELAQRILRDSENNINQLGKLSIKELIKNYKGIGEAKAITIAAALELGKRRKYEGVRDKKVIGSQDVFEYFHPMLSDLSAEELWVLLLNRNGRVIEQFRAAQGGVATVTADVKLIIKRAVLQLASGIILCHNHPSGSCAPSEEDRVLTRKVKAAASCMDITLLDHVIISDNSLYSFCDEERL